MTYKTAWRMFNQIRELMREELQLGGASTPGVEMDEMYYGGRRKNDSGRLLKGDLAKKTMVTGIVERKGRIVARVFQELTMEATGVLVKKYVLPESVVFTDRVRFLQRPSEHGLPAQAHHPFAEGLRRWGSPHEHD